MATVVQASRRSGALDLASRIYESGEDRRAENRRAQMRNMTSLAMTAINKQESESTRQLKVARASGDTARANLLREQIGTYNKLSLDEKKSLALVDIIKTENTKERNANQAAIQSLQIQNQQKEQQIRFADFMSKDKARYTNSFGEFADPAMVASAVRERDMLFSQPPGSLNEEKSKDRLEKLEDMIFKSIDAGRKREQEEAIARKAAESGGVREKRFPGKVLEDMPEDVANRARLAGVGNIDVRVMPRGKGPGGVPGVFGLGKTVYDYRGAVEEGYSDEQWDAADPIKLAATAQEVVDAAKKKRKTEVRTSDVTEPTTIEELRVLIRAATTEKDARALYKKYIDKVK